MIKRLSAVLGTVVIIAAPALGQPSTWVPDVAHSEVTFSILQLSLANVRGRFGDIRGSVRLDPSDVLDSTANVTIDVSTVDTGVAARDADLKSAHFFDVARFPTASFVKTSFEKKGSGIVVTGNLTLHGITRPVILQVEGPRGPVTGSDRKPHHGFSGTATIDRTAFGIGMSYPAAILSDEVKLTIDLDLVKQ